MHHHPPASQRGTYTDFVDELFRLGLVDQAQRDMFRTGLSAMRPAPLVPASSAGLPHPGFAAARRAEDAGLVRSTEAGLHIGCGAETVHWG